MMVFALFKFPPAFASGTTLMFIGAIAGYVLGIRGSEVIGVDRSTRDGNRGKAAALELHPP